MNQMIFSKIALKLGEMPLSSILVQGFLLNNDQIADSFGDNWGSKFIIHLLPILPRFWK